MTSKVRSVTVGVAILLGSLATAQEQTAVAVSEEEIVGDAGAGEQVFRRCASCHEIGEGAENGVGPILSGVVGRPAAAVADYEYSDAMLEAGEAGLVWTVADLQAYLERPREVVAGTKMAFPGLRSEEQRNDVIAYLFEASSGNGEE